MRWCSYKKCWKNRTCLRVYTDKFYVLYKAHITRKLKGMIENTKHNLSDNMKQLLENTLNKRKENIDIKI